MTHPTAAFPHVHRISTCALAWLLVASALSASTPQAFGIEPPDGEERREVLNLRLESDTGLKILQLKRDARGDLYYTLEGKERESVTLSPDELAELLMGPREESGIMARVLNISSPIGLAWVAVGLLGQMLFTGRMLVQWIASERQKRSVVPVAFWWMSLIGATMLLVYFVWRRDIVGVLGQSTGWFIYCRNLLLISRVKAST